MTTTPALRPGGQLASTTCTTKVVVVRAPAGGNPVIACGGAEMVTPAPGRPSPAGAGSGGTLIGKRYVDSSGELELLCVAAGAGELTCDGVSMSIKAAKPLPASD